jgi:hypothetical protein
VLVPSTQREVGEWVSTVARDTLRKRDETLRRIETEPDASGPPMPLPSAPSTAGTSNAGKAARAPSLRTAMAVASLLVVAAIAWLGGAFYGRGQRPSASAVASETSTAAAVGASADPAVPSASVAASASAEPPAPSADSTGSAVQAAAVPSASQPAHPWRPKRSGCNPPYRIDRGIKVAKLECL